MPAPTSVQPQPTAGDFDRLLATAHAAADASAPVVMGFFRRPIDVENKDQIGGYDPVTEADRGAERAMLDEIRARHADHAILGEEFGDQAGTSPYQWILDPIDGTRAFIMGSPLWGSLIGLRHGEVPVLGLMDQPFTGERFWSGQHESFMRRDPASKPQLITTRACTKLSDAILTTTHPDLFEMPSHLDTFESLKRSVRLTRYGGDCYHYCLLASGFVDLIVESGLKSYDIAALIPIVERAGGVVTTWTGGPASEGGNIIAAGDLRVHEAALEMIARNSG